MNAAAVSPRPASSPAMAVMENEMAHVRVWQREHQDTCTERYQALDGQIVRLHSRIDQLWRLIMGISITSAVTLATLLAQVAMHSVK